MSHYADADHSPNPARPTAGDTVPPPLTFARAVLGWTVDPLVAVGLLAALVLYATGVRRVRRSGRSWPGSRTSCFVAGLVVIGFATMSGFASYDNLLFSVHMAQHLLLGMVAPLLLALGAPVTLLLAAGSTAARHRVARVLAARPVAVVSNPALAWVLFVGSPFALYFTPLYELSLRNAVVHALVHAHFLISGSLLCWPLVGIDPVPHRQPAGARMLYAVLTLPFHAFLGIAIMGSRTLLAGDYYRELGRTWGSSPLSDQKAGGGLLWAAGDLVGFVLVVLLLREWVRGDETASRREDRRLDAAERAAGQLSGPGTDAATRPN